MMRYEITFKILRNYKIPMKHEEISGNFLLHISKFFSRKENQNKIKKHNELSGS